MQETQANQPILSQNKGLTVCTAVFADNTQNCNFMSGSFVFLANCIFAFDGGTSLWELIWITVCAQIHFSKDA